jgi:hypothetical protein
VEFLQNFLKIFAVEEPDSIKAADLNQENLVSKKSKKAKQRKGENSKQPRFRRSQFLVINLNFANRGSRMHQVKC